uniref:Uncharacterized protein n=1 Tax=viral metagenome TaxID=1070528 RepID=A0A6M3K9P1_9ZZZZ
MLCLCGSTDITLNKDSFVCSECGAHGKAILFDREILESYFKVLNRMRHIPWGYIAVDMKDGIPVMFHKIREDEKL